MTVTGGTALASAGVHSSAPVTVPALAADAPNLNHPAAGYAQAGADLTSTYMQAFWNRAGGNIFSAPTPTAETVPSSGNSSNGYTLWPSLLGLHGLVEGERQRPGAYSYWIWQVYSGLGQYWNADWHGYMAWKMFPGNDDSYYDDNAWVVITLVEAYEATRTSDPAHAAMYLGRANEVMSQYEVHGWNSDSIGGVRWGTSATAAGATDRTTSATAGAALAAFLLHRNGQRPTWGGTWLDWGAGAVKWIVRRLCDSDGLIMDGFKDNGEVMRTKWTYNTGVTMRALVEHYRESGDRTSLTAAESLGRAALDHNGGLFDNSVNDSSKRFWWDGVYFVHYLVDGLLRLREATGDAALRSSIAAEVRREAAYTYNYLRDQQSGDGMYWRNMRLWRIGPYQLQVWQQITGQTRGLSQDPSEMNGSQYVKTLLANAGVARLFWQVGASTGP
ncbi:glycoside hydrolase family 76 protein [Catenuloplanes japonicus]|uniref:glycoside hydrolase family 76 protein n=1 Tax=Catenuloplanes japonicus TaxID=33876 RepID=UPI0018DD92FE|nr:glycoside hydrolase family 76 protein [Catenuloplanes japonicus]